MYQYTVISWLCGEQSNYCPEVVEKIWEIEGLWQQFPRSSPLPRGQWFDCSPSSLEFMFYYPIVLNHRNTVNSTPMLVGTFDVLWRHLSRDQSTVHCRPVISFFCCPLTKKLQNYRATVKMSNIDLNRALCNKSTYCLHYSQFHDTFSVLNVVYILFTLQLVPWQDQWGSVTYPRFDSFQVSAFPVNWVLGT